MQNSCQSIGIYDHPKSYIIPLPIQWPTYTPPPPLTSFAIHCSESFIFLCNINLSIYNSQLHLSLLVKAWTLDERGKA